MNKSERKRKILHLIGSRNVQTQEYLVQLLADGDGIEVSQGTLSRDLRELSIVKTSKGYELVDRIHRPNQDDTSLARVLDEFLLQIQTAQNLVVLHTHPGGANVVAQQLDAVDWKEIVGTIAGDDTVFVATTGTKTALGIQQRLEKL